MSVREAGAALRWSICCGRGWTSKLAIVGPDDALGRWRPRESLAVQLPHGYRDYGRREVMLGEWSPTANAVPGRVQLGGASISEPQQGPARAVSGARNAGVDRRRRAMPQLVSSMAGWVVSPNLAISRRRAANVSGGVDEGNEHAPSCGADGGKCWLEHQPNRGWRAKGRSC